MTPLPITKSAAQCSAVPTSGWLTPHGNQSTCPDWSAPDSATSIFGNRLTSAYLGRSWRSDITFYVEQEDLTIPAHSLIVAAASPVLDRCCFADNHSVQPVPVIAVPNCSADSFWVMLRYLYQGADQVCEDGNESNLDAFIAKLGLTIENAAEVLCLTERYELQQLQRICTRLILSELDLDNVCGIFERIHMLKDQVVRQHCLQKIMFHSWQVLGTVMQWQSESAIAQVLRADELRLRNETDLFNAMCDWADANPTENPRELLQTRLQHVRFGCMAPPQFAHCIRRAGENFFTEAEIGIVFRQIALRNNYVADNPFELLDGTHKKADDGRHEGDYQEDTAEDGNTEHLSGDTEKNVQDSTSNEDNTDDGNEEEELNEPPTSDPYWCRMRSRIWLSKQYSKIASAVNRGWADKTVIHEFCIAPVDLSYQYALTGLTIPCFKGKITVQNQTQRIDTSLKYSILHFKTEIPLNNDNNWKLIVENTNATEAYKINSENPDGLRILNATDGEYTMVTTVHFIKWKYL